MAVLRELIDERPTRRVIICAPERELDLRVVEAFVSDRRLTHRRRDDNRLII